MTISDKPVIVGDSRLVCPSCGYANAHTRTICKRCRVALPLEGIAAAQHSHDLVEQYRTPPKWYQRWWFLVLLFVVARPIWALVVLIDPYHDKPIKAFAAIVLIVYAGLYMLGYFIP